MKKIFASSFLPLSTLAAHAEYQQVKPSSEWIALCVPMPFTFQ
jgi:hypothetical protein